MKRLHRLTASEDFQALFKKGRRREFLFFRCTARKNGLGYARFAFITPKAVDKRAVKRNLLRRRAREWFRVRSSLLGSPFDVAIFFKKGAVEASRKKIYEEFEHAALYIKNL